MIDDEYGDYDEYTYGMRDGYLDGLRGIIREVDEQGPPSEYRSGYVAGHESGSNKRLSDSRTKGEPMSAASLATDQKYEAAIQILRLQAKGYQLWPTDPTASVPLEQATPEDYIWRLFSYGPMSTQPVTSAQLQVLAEAQT